MTWVCAALTLVGLLAGGVFWAAATHHPTFVKWRLWYHVKNQAGYSRFEVDFPFPDKKAMRRQDPTSGMTPASAKGMRTQRGFEELATEYTRGQMELLALRRTRDSQMLALADFKERLDALSASSNAPPKNIAARIQALTSKMESTEKALLTTETDLESKAKALDPVAADLRGIQEVWAAQSREADQSDLNAAIADLNDRTHEELEAATRYETVYKAVGRQLWVADKLLRSHNLDHQRLALRCARQAARDAVYYGEDAWLAARIAEAYFWPNLHLASEKSGATVQQILDECAEVFRKAEETNSLMKNFELLLTRAENPRQADSARARLAMASEQIGDYPMALKYYRQIQATNDLPWVSRRVSRLEQFAAAKKDRP